MITLDDGLSLIRMLQPVAKTHGFYLALAGGVLNNGYSNNDLDIIAVLRGTKSNWPRLKICLRGYIGAPIKSSYFVRERRVTVYHYKYRHMDIDMAVLWGVIE